MDKIKAIELLKQALEEIATLSNLRYDDEKFLLWRSKVNVILEDTFGNDSKEYRIFSQAGQKAHIRTPLMSDVIHQNDYLENLRSTKVSLKSILQKYEILGIETEPSNIEISPESILLEVPVKAFISHGKESAALRKLKEFLETLGIEPIIVKTEASLDKTVSDKVEYYLNQSDFVIILATADDEMDGKLQPRQNVSHETGLAQKTHPGRIIYLLEERAEFPSNIRPKVYERFKQRNMMNAFLCIVRELRAYDMLKVMRTPYKEQT